MATLRDRALAATGEALSPLPLGTALVELRRNFGYEGVGTAEALASSLLPIPPSLDVAALVASVHWQSAKRVPLEEKLYWALRQHGQHPKPNEKEVHEALAFFKKTEKLLGRRRLVLDVCGSHGLLGSLFVAFGRAERAVVLDLFQPASFGNLCDACRPWLEVPDRHANAHHGAHIFPPGATRGGRGWRCPRSSALLWMMATATAARRRTARRRPALSLLPLLLLAAAAAAVVVVVVVVLLMLLLTVVLLMVVLLLLLLLRLRRRPAHPRVRSASPSLWATCISGFDSSL